jgi:phosphoribosylformylglycinamidine cyclo-ligase
MGAGFAVYCAPGTGAEVVRLATDLGLQADLAGAVEDGPRRVLLEPIDVVYETGDLDLAPRRS